MKNAGPTTVAPRYQGSRAQAPSPSSRRGPMLSPSLSISPKDLGKRSATRPAPHVVDGRRRDAYEQAPQVVAGAIWVDAAKAGGWVNALDPARAVAVTSKAGHEMSQSAVAQLRADGIDA